MGVKEKEKTSVFSDKYHVVTLHGELERTLAEAVSQNIRNMDIFGNGEQLRVETLDSVGEPGQTMINVFNHVIENTTFILFFRTEDFFKDKLNGFAVSVSLEDRIQHHDPQRHYTLIPLDVGKTTKIKGKPCFDQLIGFVVSSDGAFDEHNEKKIRKMINDKLFKLNSDRGTVIEVIQEGQNRQARDICSLVMSADTSGYKHLTQQLNTSGTSLSSSTLTTYFQNNTSGIATAASEGTKDLHHEARNGTDFEMSPPSRTQDPSFQRSQDSGLNTQSSQNPSGGGYASATSDSLTASVMHRDRDKFGSASLNQPSIFSPSYMGEQSTADTFQRQTSSYLPHSVDMDFQGSVQFCVPKLIRPSFAHGNPFGYRAEARRGQQWRSYEQGPQQQYSTHFQNMYCQQRQLYPQVHPQQRWQRPSGIHREDWNKMGARPKTRIPPAPMPPDAITRRCESAPVEGGGRQEDDTLFWGSGEEHARSCHSSLEGERGRNKRRNWKEEEGRGRGGGGGGSGAVIAQRQTSTNSYCNPPNNQVPLSEVGKNRVLTTSSLYLPPSVGRGVDSEINSNVPTIPGETLRKGREATRSQSASDDKGDDESIRGQEQPTGSAEYPPTGRQEEMRRDNDRNEIECLEKYRTNSAACKEAELTMPTHTRALKEMSETSSKVPPHSQRKERYGGCLNEDTPKGILTQPTGPINCRRPGSFEDDTDIFGLFPELDDVMSEMSKCSLTPPSSPKFGNDRSNQASLEYDCAPSYYLDQEEHNGAAAASHRQQNQGPRDESPQRQQLQRPPHQQQERMLNQQQQAREQLPQPHQQCEQQYRQQEGEGFAELHGRPDLAEDRGVNRSRSSRDTDSGRGTI